MKKAYGEVRTARRSPKRSRRFLLQLRNNRPINFFTTHVLPCAAALGIYRVTEIDNRANRARVAFENIRTLIIEQDRYQAASSSSRGKSFLILFPPKGAWRPRPFASCIISRIVYLIMNNYSATATALFLRRDMCGVAWAF